MGRGNEERGYSLMKSLIKGYGREKRLGYTGLGNVGSLSTHSPRGLYSLSLG
jgi:hypothetical protein